MRKIFFILFALAIVSCKENPVQEYGDAVVMKPLETAKTVSGKTETEALRNAVNEYYAANGRYPLSLDELKAATGLKFDPSKYEYDPQRGDVKLLKNSD